MSARAARHRRQSEVAANRHRQSKPPSREHLQRENDRLRRENEELRREVVRREKQIADAEKQIADAEKQIADLERQLALRKRNSTNSSKPPSSDGLAGEQRPRGRKHKGKRKPGGQPGHTGHHRPLLPTAEVNAVEERLPKQCEHCGGKLPQKPGQVTTEGAPRRHQVTEVPPVKAHAGDYDRLSRYMPIEAEAFYRRLAVPPGSKLLDVACGSGQLALIAACNGADATGIDIAEN